VDALAGVSEFGLWFDSAERPLLVLLCFYALTVTVALWRCYQGRMADRDKTIAKIEAENARLSVVQDFANILRGRPPPPAS
jgi:hypothetical protein